MIDANPKSDRAAGGFTLLEVMLAVTILGLLLATVYGAVTRTQSSKEHAEDRAELFAGGRQAVLKIASDVEGALTPPSGDRIYFRGQAAREGTLIEFVTVNRGGYGVNRVRPGRVLIVYSLDPIQHMRGAFALRREEYLYAAMLAEADGIELAKPDDFGLGEQEEPEQPTAQASYILDCPNVAQEFTLPGSCMRVLALRFRYYDDVVRDWRDEWNSAEENSATSGRLPAAVEIALLVADEDGGEHDFTTIVDLPLARGQPTPSDLGGGAGQDDGDDGDDADDADDGDDDDPPPTRRR